MSYDEFIVLCVGLVVATLGWIGWYAQAVRVTGLGGGRLARGPVLLMPVACVILLLVVLKQLADPEVRSDVFYKALFAAAGALSLLAIGLLAAVLGEGAIDDAVERRNSAAAWATCGAWLADTLVNCGANLGTGPTIYTTLGPMLMALAALAGLWVGFSTVTANHISIGVDRDRASGVRLAGLLMAWGLIFGRAIAGDWVSVQGTLDDFVAQGWPALALLIVAAMVEFLVRPGRSRPAPRMLRAGVAPAALYLAMAAAWLAWLGRWEGLAGPGRP